MPASFLVAGIVNVTPDSFSDGGLFLEPSMAMELARRHVYEGAQMVDIGAESTRPGATGIGHALEWRRLEPVLHGVIDIRDGTTASPPEHAPSFAVSVDTFRADTARAACLAGADIINDISGAVFEPAMVEVLAEHRPGYVLGHSPARPADMQKSPRYDSVVDTLARHFTEQMDTLVKAGLPEAHISLDPCIGFGKTLEHTAAIIRSIPRLLELGRPLYFGISRKSFFGEAAEAALEERDVPTQVATALLAAKGVMAHRVHDVAAARRTLRLVQRVFL